MNDVVKQDSSNLDHLSYSLLWLKRAQRDFNAYKKLVPGHKDDLKNVRCSDPALALYLLQQSIEKASKSVIVATGLYDYKDIINFKHNSFEVLLDFYKTTLSIFKNNSFALALFTDISGRNIAQGSQKIDDVLSKCKIKPSKSNPSEITISEQSATIAADDVDTLLDYLIIIRTQGYIGALSKLFKPHGKIQIVDNKLDFTSPANFSSSLLDQFCEQLNVSDLPKEAVEKISNAVEYLFLNSKLVATHKQRHIIKRADIERQTLGQWSLLALLFLAALTYPHEATTRYPGPPKKDKRLQGFEDYDMGMGIIMRLGRLGHVASLAIRDLKPELEAIFNTHTSI